MVANPQNMREMINVKRDAVRVYRGECVSLMAPMMTGEGTSPKRCMMVTVSAQDIGLHCSGTDQMSTRLMGELIMNSAQQLKKNAKKNT